MDPPAASSKSVWWAEGTRVPGWWTVGWACGLVYGVWVDLGFHNSLCCYQYLLTWSEGGCLPSLKSLPGGGGDLSHLSWSLRTSGGFSLFGSLHSLLPLKSVPQLFPHASTICAQGTRRSPPLGSGAQKLRFGSPPLLAKWFMHFEQIFSTSES